MNVLEVFKSTLINPKIITAITSTVVIILLGYFCRRKNIFKDSDAQVLTNVVLTVSLPALSFRAFMSDIDPVSLREGMNVLIWGILMFPVLMVLTKPIYAKYEGDTQDTLRVLSMFGSTTFFGTPIVAAIYGDQGVLYASIFNIGYRIFLYSYAYIKMSGLPMNKENLGKIIKNPIIIATIAGLLIWIFQDSLPQVALEVAGDGGEMITKSVCFLRVDHTAPWLHQILNYLANLASPLAWLSIGITLGSQNISEAVKDKTTWYYTFVKTMIIPLINVVILIVLTKTNILPVSSIGLGTVAIMMATPPATVAVSYAINFEKEPLLASNASLLSTFMAVIAIPIWIVIVNIISNLGLI